MKVPTDIQAIIRRANKALAEHPEHHFDWRIRYSLYEIMAERYGEKGRLAHGWLAISAAKKVLPIFLNHFDHDLLPGRLLTIAEGLIKGEKNIEEDELDQLEDEGYFGTGLDCMAWRGTIAYNAEYAGLACYKAFLEVRAKHYFLDRTESLIRGKEVTAWYLEGKVKPEAVTDKELAHFSTYSDTAASAAMAFASEVNEYRLDSHRLSNFWEWWSTQAVRDAWALV